MRTINESFREARKRQQRMRKIERMDASYRSKLNAMLMVDQRKGQLWG